MIEFGRLGPPRYIGFLDLHVGFTDLLGPIPRGRSNRARHLFTRRRVEEAEVDGCGHCNQHNTPEDDVPFDLPVIANLHISSSSAEFLVARLLQIQTREQKVGNFYFPDPARAAPPSVP